MLDRLCRDRQITYTVAAIPSIRAARITSVVQRIPFHTAGATGSIPVPPTILHQAARGASVNPIVSRLPTAVAAFWTVSSRT